MIERHYGALLDGAGAEIAGRLDALDARADRGHATTPRTFRPLPGQSGAVSARGAQQKSDVCRRSRGSG